MKALKAAVIMNAAQEHASKSTTSGYKGKKKAQEDALMLKLFAQAIKASKK